MTGQVDLHCNALYLTNGVLDNTSGIVLIFIIQVG